MVHRRPMSSPAFLSLFLTTLLIALAASSSAESAGDNASSVYEVLQEYDFPPGLLPQSVTGYEIDRSTGKFRVYLEKTCRFHISGYELEYKTTISGVIEKDRIRNLRGIKVNVLLLWFSIDEVVRDGHDLEFYVGIASANFPVFNFEQCPQCGCGFDCVNGDGKFRPHRLASPFLFE